MTETQIGLAGTGLSSEQRLLSLRYVVDHFAQKGKVESDADLSGAFAQMMDETQRRLADLTQAVGSGNFQIAYQPICDLSSGKTSHYEALARFSGKQDTGETIQFMEALGVAGALDLAVANKVISLVDQLPDVHIAFNVSADTIANPASFGVLAGMLAKRRRLAPRLLIEITETANIGNLETAGKAIAALREMGYRVGLDDFGAGAASLNYLHAFPVDFVKFDGKLIHQIGQSQRDDALLAGLAKLCAEMKVDTIAEWIESEPMAKAALNLGFRHGQGRWMGPPLRGNSRPAAGRQAQGCPAKLGVRRGSSRGARRMKPSSGRFRASALSVSEAGPAENAHKLDRVPGQPHRPKQPHDGYDRNSTVIIILSGRRIFLKPVASLHSLYGEDGLSCWHCPPLAFSSRFRWGCRSSPPGLPSRD